MRPTIVHLACLLLISGCGGGNTKPPADGASGASGGSSSGGSGNGGGASGMQLTISTAVARLKASGTQTFTCSSPCTFSVEEGASGGTITSDGLYTAPDGPGTWHVLGKAGGQTATATVVVPTPALGTPGVWEDVTPPDADPERFAGSSGFGVGTVVSDPARPSDLYVGGQGYIWKSTDYGITWDKLSSEPNPPPLPLGNVLAVAGTTPPTVLMANVHGEQHLWKSVDGGATFRLTGAIPEAPQSDSLYSIVVDPNDPDHLLTGLHEQDKVLESTDGGETWYFVTGTGFPGGGRSWYPWFLDTGDPATTRLTWFAIAQDGGSAIKTTDGGKNWTTPSGVSGLQHPHGSAGLLQSGQSLFCAGVNGEGGNGVYRSLDLGDNWEKMTENSAGVVWGSEKHVYAMWGWACADCGINESGPQYKTSPQPGDQWTEGTLPAELDWGPNSVATTSDGTRTIYVGSMWGTGLWRYVEP